jgi:ketosteroid isomerase-like protein
MSSDNVTVVRRGYEALAAGEFEQFLGLLAPDVEWTHPEGLPYSGTHRGLAGMQDVLRLWGESYEVMQVIPEEFLDAGDAVVVIGRYHVRPHGGDDVETWFVNVFELADGKVRRFRDYSDKALRLAPAFSASTERGARTV